MKTKTRQRLAKARLPMLFGSAALGLLYFSGAISWAPIDLFVGPQDYPAGWSIGVPGALTWAFLGAVAIDLIDYTLRLGSVAKSTS